ncbi:MAG: hypothetical protein GC189_10070 [Alphaproteobacteria bacterium]|nr:hypothetical protein [Alphaproteobacteria bacterium]
MSAEADALTGFLGPDVYDRLSWTALNDEQRAAILCVFRLGLNAGAASGAIAAIDAILADGRVVLCEDGTQWEARAEDAHLVEEWGEGALVAIHRGMLYRLDEWEAVEVEPLRL